MNRPPLPPITTTRSIHIPDPSSVLQYINSCPHKVPTATKTKRKTPLPTLPQNLDLPSSSNIPITFLPEPSLKLTDEEQFPSTTFNKETDIPSTIDLQPEPFNQYSSFPYKQKEQIPQNTSMDNQSDIHDYDNFINPRRHSYNRYNFRPQPRKDYRLFLGEKDIISLSQKSC